MDMGPHIGYGDDGSNDGSGYIPFYVSLQYDPPEDSQADPVVFPNTYKVNVGWGYVCERMSDTGIVLTYHYPERINTPIEILPEQFVCVKVHIKAGGSIGEPDPPEPIAGDTVIVVLDDADIVDLAATDSAPGYFYYKLAELVPDEDPENPPSLVNWLTGSHIDHYITDGGGNGAAFSHMWQATLDSVDESDAGTFTVKKGIVVVQGSRVEVPDTVVTSSYPDSIIALKVTRDSSSRAYDDTYVPQILLFEKSVFPLSSDTAEYTVIAEVTQVITPAPTEEDPTATVTTYDILQCRNDEICSFELLIVSNGEFALMPFQANSRNSYAPPIPVSP